MRRILALPTLESIDMAILMPYLAKRNFQPIMLPDNTVYVEIEDEEGEQVTAFYFKDAVVIWGIGREQEEVILSDLLPPFLYPAPMDEAKIMFFMEADKGESSHMKAGVLFVRPEKLDKLSFSHALAKSVILGDLETKTEKVLSEIRDYPQTLATMGAIKKTSLVFVNRMQGLLYDIRADINLYSQLLDPPDLLWNDPSLEPLFNRLARHLKIQSRIEKLNQRLDYGDELFSIYRNQIVDKQSHRRTIIIIALILIEVLLKFLPEEQMHHWLWHW